MAVAGIHRFTVDDFARMGEAGILSEDDRVELIDGGGTGDDPDWSPHAWIVDRLTVLMATRLAGTAHLRVQGPIRLGRHTEPQPDLSVSRSAQAYMNRHPDADDLLLVIEVSDSSLQYDRGEKVPRYGKAGVPRPGWWTSRRGRSPSTPAPARRDTPASGCCVAESASRRARSPSSTFRWKTSSGEPGVCVRRQPPAATTATGRQPTPHAMAFRTSSSHGAVRPQPQQSGAVRRPPAGAHDFRSFSPCRDT